MDKRIWKWPLNMTSPQDLPIPLGGQFLTVQLQDGNPQVWFLCDPYAPVAPRRLAIYGTGHPVPEFAGSYLGTFQIGRLVWHLFEVWHPSSSQIENQRIDL